MADFAYWGGNLALVAAYPAVRHLYPEASIQAGSRFFPSPLTQEFDILFVVILLLGTVWRRRANIIDFTSTALFFLQLSNGVLFYLTDNAAFAKFSFVLLISWLVLSRSQPSVPIIAPVRAAPIKWVSTAEIAGWLTMHKLPPSKDGSRARSKKYLVLFCSGPSDAAVATFSELVAVHPNEDMVYCAVDVQRWPDAAELVDVDVGPFTLHLPSILLIDPFATTKPDPRSGVPSEDADKDKEKRDKDRKDKKEKEKEGKNAVYYPLQKRLPRLISNDSTQVESIVMHRPNMERFFFTSE